MGIQLYSYLHNSGLCTKKNHGSAMRNLSLWIGSCVHCIRAWFSVGIPSTKPLTVWKMPGCVVAVEHNRTDWEGNTAWFVQQRAAAQNISLWFGVTKGKCLLLSSSALSVIGLLFLSWLTTECILLCIQCQEKNNTLNELYLLSTEVSYNYSGTAATSW